MGRKRNPVFVSDKTKKDLEKLKLATNADSFDEAIRSALLGNDINESDNEFFKL